MPRIWVKLVAAAILLMVDFELARASTLLDQSDVIGLPSVAAPAQFSFSTTAAATVTLTDFATPAAFQALQIAVMAGDTVAGTAAIDSMTHKATVALSAAGDYTAYIVGLPDAMQQFGSFGVCVALTGSPGTCVANYSNSFTTPTPPSASSTSTVTTSFNTTTVAGNYTLTLTDDAFPSALQSLSAGVFVCNGAGQANIPPGSTQIALPASSNCELLIAAQADATTKAGLYGIRITDPSGTVVFDHTYPVGTLAPATTVANPSNQALTLTLTDDGSSGGYPQMLGALGAAVTLGGTLAGSLAAPGTTTFSTAAGSVSVWTYAVAGTEAGLYNLKLTGASGTLLSSTQTVNPGNSGSSGSFGFVATLPAAGTYQLVTTDFQFPGALVSLAPHVAQNGAQLTLGANNDFTAAAGTLVIVVDATAISGSSGSFDVAVETTGASPSVVFEQSQAVGGVFNSQTITVGTSGGFQATLTDQAFPQNFSDLALFVAQGGTVLGKVYGGGSFTFPTSPGKYVVTFIATPSSNQATASTVPDYGLYTINISSAPPTLSLSASASSITSGTPVTLTWSSTDATSCTASGASGWTGNEATSGSQAIALSSTATLTLSCTGPGGTVQKSVNVTVKAASGGGGGGALDALTLGLLGALSVAAGSRRQRAAR